MWHVDTWPDLLPQDPWQPYSESGSCPCQERREPVNCGVNLRERDQKHKVLKAWILCDVHLIGLSYMAWNQNIGDSFPIDLQQTSQNYRKCGQSNLVSSWGNYALRARHGKTACFREQTYYHTCYEYLPAPVWFDQFCFLWKQDILKGLSQRAT